VTPADHAGEAFLRRHAKGATPGEAFEEALRAWRGKSNTPLENVAKDMGARADLIRSRSRLPEIVRTRDEAAWRMRESGMTYSAIGRALGGMNHSSVITAVRRHIGRRT